MILLLVSDWSPAPLCGHLLQFIHYLEQVWWLFIPFFWNSASLVIIHVHVCAAENFLTDRYIILLALEFRDLFIFFCFFFERNVSIVCWYTYPVVILCVLIECIHVYTQDYCSVSLFLLSMYKIKKKYIFFTWILSFLVNLSHNISSLISNVIYIIIIFPPQWIILIICVTLTLVHSRCCVNFHLF